MVIQSRVMLYHWKQFCQGHEQNQMSFCEQREIQSAALPRKKRQIKRKMICRIKYNQHCARAWETTYKSLKLLKDTQSLPALPRDGALGRGSEPGMGGQVRAPTDQISSPNTISTLPQSAWSWEVQQQPEHEQPCRFCEQGTLSNASNGLKGSAELMFHFL